MIYNKLFLNGITRAALILCMHAIGSTLVRADQEWSNFNPDTDVWQLPPFVVSAEDPDTFDWDGFYDFLELTGNQENQDFLDYYLSIDYGYIGQASSTAQSSQNNVTGNNSTYNQASNGTCFIASMRYIMNARGVTPQSEQNLLNQAMQNITRPVSEIEQRGFQRKEYDTAIANVIQNTNLSATRVNIGTSSDAHTQPLALTAFTTALQNNGSTVIANYYVTRWTDYNTYKTTIQTHAQVLENINGTIRVWDPQNGNYRNVGTINDAFNDLMDTYRSGGDEERIKRGLSVDLIPVTSNP